MTTRQLTQYPHLLREVSRLEQRIALYSSAGRVSDTVRGSMECFPFTQRTFRIEGESAKLRKLQAQLKRRRARLVLELADIETYVDGIDDSFMRQIITARFIEGRSWRQVAMTVGGGNTEGSVKKACQRFLAKN